MTDDLDARTETRSIAILVKTYRHDCTYVERLVASLNAFNVDALPVHFLVPDNDLVLFRDLVGSAGDVIPESIMGHHLVGEASGGFSSGFLNQEIAKLCFWEFAAEEAYLCLDSDAELIAPLHRELFVDNEGLVYTFLTADRELEADPWYHARYWESRMRSLQDIADVTSVQSDRILTTHGHSVFSSVALSSFKMEFLDPLGWSYADAVRYSPYEPTWYNMWMQRRQPIALRTREPIVKTFHSAVDFLEYRLRGLGRSEVARGFPIVVVNSNFSRGYGVLDLDEPVAETVAKLVTWRMLLFELKSRLLGLPGRWWRTFCRWVKPRQ